MNSNEQHIQALEERLTANLNSPLFAQLASYYLEAGRTQDALSMCDRGLAQFPFYTTGHLIKGKTLVALKMYAEARREFELVKEFLPTNRTVADLLAEVPQDEEITFSSPDAPKVFKPRNVRKDSFGDELRDKPKLEPSSVEETLAPLTEAPIQPHAVVSAAVVEESGSPFDQLQATPSFGEQVLPLQESAPAETPEDAFAQLGISPVASEQTPVSDPFDTVPSSGDDAFGFGGLETAQQEPSEATSSPFEETTPAEPESPFAALQPSGESPFGLGTQVISPFETPASSPPTETTSPFETPVHEFGAPSEEESFEQYAQRMRMELAGTEGSMSLDDYLGSDVIPNGTDLVQPSAMGFESIPSPISEVETVVPSTVSESSPPPTEEKNEIEEIAEKLQTAKKIIPIINLADKTPRTVTEAETPASTGFVTPTLAEIYAKQGWYDDAIKAYKNLMVTKPAEREKFEKRVRELEESKAQQGAQL